MFLLFEHFAKIILVPKHFFSIFLFIYLSSINSFNLFYRAIILKIIMIIT